MSITSFDIFDTCVVRKCGAPKNLFDILSHKVFSEKVSAERRLEFITQRLSADDTTTYNNLYSTFSYQNPSLISIDGIMQKELECEHKMIVPVNSMLQEVEKCRNRGDRIFFISDMYLPTTFLKNVLSETGFYKEGDAVYVSGDCGCKKKDGSLYKWIKEKENIEYADWQHYGDNFVSDVQIPASLGINTHHINHNYLPYEDLWKDKNVSLKYHIGGIMAGIGRSILLTIKENHHNAFAIDVAAPLLSTFAMRIMSDAARRGIKKLFFCSRDCYALYYVAKKIEKVVPTVEAVYFYTSREALYNTQEKDLITYLIYIGLAQTKEVVGVVDMRSTGKSLLYLNDVLCKNGFKPVFGYYFEMFCSNFYTDNVPPYYCEINALYCSLFAHHHPILEKFLSLCPDGRTSGYDVYTPIMDVPNDGEDLYVQNLNELSTVNLKIMEKYAEGFIETELYRYTDEMFSSYVIPTLESFFSNPNKIYLHSLRYLFLLQGDGSYIPYIEKKEENTALFILQKRFTSKVRVIRGILKIIVLLFNIKPTPNNEWWPQGTKVYNE